MSKAIHFPAPISRAYNIRALEPGEVPPGTWPEQAIEARVLVGDEALLLGGEGEPVLVLPAPGHGDYMFRRRDLEQVLGYMDKLQR
jgi:hypothetical protein